MQPPKSGGVKAATEEARSSTSVNQKTKPHCPNPKFEGRGQDEGSKGLRPIRIGINIGRQRMAMLQAPVANETSVKRKAEQSNEPIKRHRVEHCKAEPNASSIKRIAAHNDEQQRSDHNKSKRTKLEVFELGDESDAEDAECPTSPFENEPPERGLKFNHISSLVGA